MIPEFGTLFIVLALAAACCQSLALSGVLARTRAVASLTLTAAWVQALALSLAFAILIQLRIDDDFTVENVAQHSNRSLDLLYKITGAWGNHEGSMLLWVWLLAVYGLGLALSRKLPSPIAARAGAVQGLLGVGFLLFILFTSNPFARLFPPPADGAMLNPLLQDVGLAIHPPLLYGGYVGFSVVYALAIAALLESKLDAAFARALQPWILLSWSLLTLGIGLGSWWAYRELGWGGWWFWDPVENASLLPWLCGTALLHANLVLARRAMLPRWVALLAIITFSLSLLGTFLVRSGVLTSVHSFASDPARGVFILAYLVLVTGGGLWLHGMRAPLLAQGGRAVPLSREGMIVINNLLLLVACAAVAVGTLYPLFSEWLGGDKITVGPPYFNQTFLPLMVLPVLFAGIAMLTPWRHASLLSLGRALRVPAALAIAAFIIGMAMIARGSVWLASAGFAMAVFLAASSLTPLLKRWRQSGLRQPAALYAATLSHVGFAVLVAGVTGHSLLSQQFQQVVKQGDVLQIAGYELLFRGQKQYATGNYKSEQGMLELRDSSGHTITELRPALRTYQPPSGMQTSEAAIYSTPLYDIYAVFGHTPDGAQPSLRLHANWLIGFVWSGCLLMTTGGLWPLLFARKKREEETR